MEQKAIFHFASEALDAKTTVVKVKTIQLEGQDEIYQFPHDAQTSNRHENLFGHAVTKGVVKSLKTRNKFRKVKITLKESEFLSEYMDEEGNVSFEGIYLEVVQANIPTPTLTPSTTRSAQPEVPINKIAKEMALNKFDGRNCNAGAWLEMFISECEKLNIGNNKYAEVLRLWLDGMALEWYSGVRKTSIVMPSWDTWNNSFIDTFDNKSWSDIAYAYEFKFLGGSFLEFALKKRGLLLDVDRDLTINSQINLIVTALPSEIRSRLVASQLKTVDALMSALSKIEPMTSKHSGYPKDKQHNTDKPCSYCESLGFKNRLHPVEKCRNKIKDKKKNENVKIVNNNDLENVICFSEEAKN